MSNKKGKNMFMTCLSYDDFLIKTVLEAHDY